MSSDTLNKFCRYAAISGVFLLPFVPLLITGSMFFPYITGKNFAFRIITEIVFAAWLILALKNKEYRPTFSWILASASAFVAVVAISDIFGINPLKSFWSNFERMEGFIALIHLLAYLTAVSSVLSAEKLWQRLFQTSLGVSLVVGGYGFLQLFGFFKSIQSGFRLDATFGNASYLAVYMLFHFFITALLLVRRTESSESRRRFGYGYAKWLYLSAMLFQALILYYTATRGAIVGFFLGIVLAAVLVALFEKNRPALRRGAAVAIVAGVVLALGFFSLRNTGFVMRDPVLSRVASISLEEGLPRLTIWKMAWRGVKERPIFGWGQENFNVVFNKYYEPSLYAQEQWFDRVHNIVFDWMIAAGFLGLILYLSIFVSALYYLWFGSRRPERAEAAVITGLFAAYFFHNLFVFDNIVSYLMFFTVLGYIASRHGQAVKERPAYLSRDEKPFFDDETATRMVAPLVIVVSVFSLYYFNLRGVMTARALIGALRQQPEGVERNLEFFKEALSYGHLGRQEAREQLLQGALAVSRTDVGLETKQKFAALAEEEFLKQIRENPEDARHQIFMGSFLDNMKRYGEARVYLEKALELSPGKQATLFELAMNYLNDGDKAKALSLMKEAFEQAPDFDTARILYAVVAVSAGEARLADELLLSKFGSVNFDDDRLLQAYYNAGFYDRVVEIWENRVEKDPGNAQFRISLAASYLAAGDRLKAVENIQRAIEINPNFKEQGEFYIREIRAGRNP